MFRARLFFHSTISFLMASLCDSECGTELLIFAKRIDLSASQSHRKGEHEKKISRWKNIKLVDKFALAGERQHMQIGKHEWMPLLNESLIISVVNNSKVCSLKKYVGIILNRICKWHLKKRKNTNLQRATICRRQPIVLSTKITTTKIHRWLEWLHKKKQK